MMSRSRHSLCVLVTALLAGGPASAGQGDSPVKLSITPDGRLTLNGRPYFFIGFAPGPPLDFQTPEGGDGWAEMAEGGMSVVRGGASPQGWTPAVE